MLLAPAGTLGFDELGVMAPDGRIKRSPPTPTA